MLENCCAECSFKYRPCKLKTINTGGDNSTRPVINFNNLLKFKLVPVLITLPTNINLILIVLLKRTTASQLVIFEVAVALIKPWLKTFKTWT